MIVLLLSLLYPAPAPIAAIDLAQNQGFCSPGVYPFTKAASGQPPGLKLWGSYCADGDRFTGVAQTSAFAAPLSMKLYFAGYLSNPGLSLEIENLSNQSRLSVAPQSAPGSQWAEYLVQLPPLWRGNPVRLIARDDATGMGGWFAFSEPLPTNGTLPGMREAFTLVLRTLLSFVLLILPAFAAAAFAIRNGLRDLLSLGLLQLASIGAYGYLFFVLWFIAPVLGHLLSLLVPPLLLVCLAWAWRRLDAAGRRTLKKLLLPLALVCAASLLILSAGFVYGGLDKPLDTAAQRFSHLLPPDNTIPYLFAEGVRGGRVPKPLQADWLSSDRPPLQTGLVLAQYGYVSYPRVLGYQIISVVAQSLWIFGAWLFLAALDLDPRAIALVLAVSVLSGFVFLNSFYVWPKLLAAAFMLGSFAILFTSRYRSLLGSPFLCVLSGALLAFSMLSHGGSAFAAIGAALTLLILRRFVPLKSVLWFALSAFLLYLPWICYQKFYDPPGDRLLKMHLADVISIDSRSVPEAVRDAYSSLSPQRYFANKLANFDRPFQNGEKLWVELVDLVRYFNDPVNSRQIAGVLRGWMFFHIVPNLGFLIAGPFALLAGFGKAGRTGEWRAAALMWLFVVVADFAWALLMFRPGMTIIHAGTYVTVLLGYFGSILALWAVSCLLALVIGALQVALNFLVYVVFMQPPPPPHGVLVTPLLLAGCLALSLLSLLCVLWLLWKLSRAAVPGPAPRMRQELPVAFRAGDGTLHQLHTESGAL